MLEISGLALTPDERLFAVTDERAVVYELDYSEGRVVKSFALGDPVVRGDFEGIAVLNRDAVSSVCRRSMRISLRPIPIYETKLGDYCELEGLAADKAAGNLILACKETIKKNNDLMIFELSVVDGDVEGVRRVTVPKKAIEERIDKKAFNPSGIAIDPRTGERVLIAARQYALARLTADGGLSDAIILAKKGRHRQAEGIADGRAKLAVYPAGSQGNEKSD